MKKLIIKIMGLYIPSDQLSAFREVEHTDRQLQESDLDLGIGTKARTALVALEDDSLTESQISDFYRYVCVLQTAKCNVTLCNQ